MDANSCKFVERVDVSSERLPKAPSRKESGVDAAPREDDRADMDPRDTLRSGVVGLLTDIAGSRALYSEEIWCWFQKCSPSVRHAPETRLSTVQCRRTTLADHAKLRCPDSFASTIPKHEARHNGGI